MREDVQTLTVIAMVMACNCVDEQRTAAADAESSVTIASDIDTHVLLLVHGQSHPMWLCTSGHGSTH